jgi:hypothetical protein
MFLLKSMIFIAVDEGGPTILFSPAKNSFPVGPMGQKPFVTAN